MLTLIASHAAGQDSTSEDRQAEFSHPFLEVLEDPNREPEAPTRQAVQTEPLEVRPRPDLEGRSEIPQGEQASEQSRESSEYELPALTQAELDRVRVAPHDLRMPSFGFTTASFKFVLQVTNPNDRVIKGPVLVYEGFIGDTSIGIGRTYIPDLPARGHRRYESGFIFSYVGFGRSLIEASQTGQLSLRIEGKLTSEGIESAFSATRHFVEERR